jgi:DNA topoisomerase-2
MTKKVSITNFLSNDFREFSVYDCHTNIPSLIDGFKVSQRKTMWTVINNPKSMTVEQLSSLAASYTRYHHGAVNLAGVIVGLAQDFTGSNNVNWLVPDGQFGNILSNNASSPRYISTNLNSNWKQWFKKEDDIILEFEIEDGEITEPKYFIPLVPTLLFNGSAGIGTGYSTKILSYSPKDIVENVKLAIADKQLLPLVPSCVGYKGTIKKVDGQTIYQGAYERANATALRITQLPIGYDLEKYKEILVKLIDSGEIKDFDDHSTDEKWDIVVYANREWIKQHESIIIEKLKLVTKDTENFVVWDENQRIRRFNDPNEIIKHFVKWRLDKFEQRRIKLIENLEIDVTWLNEKRRFIEYFIANSKKLVNLSKQEFTDNLIGAGFINTDKLLQIRVYNMTKDEITSLDQEILSTQKKIDDLLVTTAKVMYNNELKLLKEK